MFLANTTLSSRGPRDLIKIAVWLSYALVAYKLMSLPTKWLGVMIAVGAGVAMLLMAGRRQQLLLGTLVLAQVLPYLEVSLFYDARFGGDYRVAVSLLDVLIAAVWLETMLAQPRSERNVISSQPLSWLIIGFFIAAGLSVFAAINTNLALFELLRVVRMLLLAAVIAKSVNSKAALRTVLTGLLLLAMLQGAIAVAQRLNGGALGIKLLEEKRPIMLQELAAGEVYSRVGGSMGHPNELARLLDLLLPLAFAVFISTSENRDRRLSLAALFCGGIALFATLSRAAWIGSLFGFALVFRQLLKEPALRAYALRSLRVMLAGAALLLIVNFGTFVARFTANDRGSTASRSYMAEVAMKVIQIYPLAGVGIGNYKLVLPEFGNRDYKFSIAQKVHNMYLLIAAEMGIVTLLLYLGIVLAALRGAFKLMQRRVPDLTAAAAGLAGGLLAFTIHAGMDYVEIGRAPVVWIFIGLIWAMQSLPKREAAASPSASIK